MVLTETDLYTVDTDVGVGYNVLEIFSIDIYQTWVEFEGSMI